MEALTKPMNPIVRCQELEPLAASLLPADGWPQGVENPQGFFPSSVICFCRRETSRLSGGWPIRSHHDRHVLVIALRGGGVVSVDGGLHRLGPGEGLLMEPFAFHSYPCTDSLVCWLFITFHAPATAYRRLAGGGARRLGEGEWFLLRECLTCWNEPERHPLLPPHLGLLLARLTERGPGRSPDAGLSVAEREFLRTLNRQLIPRLGRPLDIRTLARAMGHSESHLRARFRQITGGSLGRHLRQLRIERACHLLHTTALGIGEIAHQCGFASPYAFSRTFREERGVPPSQYRAIREGGPGPLPHCHGPAGGTDGSRGSD